MNSSTPPPSPLPSPTTPSITATNRGATAKAAVERNIALSDLKKSLFCCDCHCYCLSVSRSYAAPQLCSKVTLALYLIAFLTIIHSFNYAKRENTRFFEVDCVFLVKNKNKKYAMTPLITKSKYEKCFHVPTTGTQYFVMCVKVAEDIISKYNK